MNSTDSRYYGPVSMAQVKGRVILKFWPLSTAGIVACVPPDLEARQIENRVRSLENPALVNRILSQLSRRCIVRYGGIEDTGSDIAYEAIFVAGQEQAAPNVPPEVVVVAVADGGPTIPALDAAQGPLTSAKGPSTGDEGIDTMPEEPARPAADAAQLPTLQKPPPSHVGELPFVEPARATAGDSKARPPSLGPALVTEPPGLKTGLALTPVDDELSCLQFESTAHKTLHPDVNPLSSFLK
jgi:hypothetical protein